MVFIKKFSVAGPSANPRASVMKPILFSLNLQVNIRNSVDWRFRTTLLP
jgi:hypothetical protein